jgi:hypothetical protein
MFFHLPEKTDYGVNQSILLSPALTVGKRSGESQEKLSMVGGAIARFTFGWFVFSRE